MQIQLQALFSFGRKGGKAKKTDFSCLHWQPPPLFWSFQLLFSGRGFFQPSGFHLSKALSWIKIDRSLIFFAPRLCIQILNFPAKKSKPRARVQSAIPFFHAGTPFFPGNELWQVVSFFKSIQNSFVGLKRALIDVSFEPALFLKSPTTPSASPRRGRTESFEAGIPDVF